MQEVMIMDLLTNSFYLQHLELFRHSYYHLDQFRRERRQKEKTDRFWSKFEMSKQVKNLSKKLNCIVIARSAINLPFEKNPVSIEIQNPKIETPRKCHDVIAFGRQKTMKTKWF